MPVLQRVVTVNLSTALIRMQLTVVRRAETLFKQMQAGHKGSLNQLLHQPPHLNHRPPLRNRLPPHRNRPRHLNQCRHPPLLQRPLQRPLQPRRPGLFKTLHRRVDPVAAVDSRLRQCSHPLLAAATMGDFKAAAVMADSDRHHRHRAQHHPHQRHRLLPHRLQRRHRHHRPSRLRQLKLQWQRASTSSHGRAPKTQRPPSRKPFSAPALIKAHKGRWMRFGLIPCRPRPMVSSC